MCACSEVNVVMNCDKLSDLTTKYEAKKTALRDLADLWAANIRAKKAPKRKQVCSKRLLLWRLACHCMRSF